MLLRPFQSCRLIPLHRKRLDRWQISALPGHSVPRALRRLQSPKQKVKPAVQAVYLHSLLNGWATRRRMRSVASAPFVARVPMPLSISAATVLSNNFLSYSRRSHASLPKSKTVETQTINIRDLVCRLARLLFHTWFAIVFYVCALHMYSPTCLAQ